ncbi:MAG TPA: uracil-DNA glycosylase family protein [Polyangiaceae bacterium]
MGPRTKRAERAEARPKAEARKPKPSARGSASGGRRSPAPPRSTKNTNELAEISRQLSLAVDRLRFGAPIRHVYNPLDYARAPHEAYLARYGDGPKKVLLVGMNPGPFGMAQTGVPFGDVAMVRDFMNVFGAVTRPPNEHPKRPILGFACPRSEVSGTRLWGLARDRFGTAARFFEDFFVTNYCPLVFMEASARNFTPDKLPASERDPLFHACDRALSEIVRVLEPRFVIGVGAFATNRARAALTDYSGVIGTVLHPSPASPKANTGWAKIVEQELAQLGVALP